MQFHDSRLGRGATADLAGGERRFTLQLRDEAGKLLARQPLHVTDSEASGVAAVLYQACSDVCGSMELWSGDAPVSFATRYTGAPTRDELSSRAQEIVLERELALQDSRTRIAESRRLLKEICDWSVDKGPQDSHS